MTVNVGDKVVMIPLRGGGYAAVRSGDISVGDKVIMIPGQDGRYYAIKPASPFVGDRVILYPLRGGGYVCLPSADDAGGGSSTPVLPPANFQAIRDGPSTAALSWALNSGNDAVRIVRRPDRYPVRINDGTVIYEGAATALEDSGLDFRLPYYYCAWGKEGSHYSNGYLMDYAPKYGVQSSPLLVCTAWNRAVSQRYETVDYTVHWFWDGQGTVYLSANPTVTASVAVDDAVDVATPLGSKTLYCGNLTWYKPALNITSILAAGSSNTITVTIRDIYAGKIGTATPLYIMRAL
jgi:hypothetical protein